MKRLDLGHVGAISAALAGVVRGVLIFVPTAVLGHPGQETVYMAVDLAILLTLMGLATVLGRRLGLLGLVGLVVAAAGLVIIRTGERDFLGPAAYSTGAALLSIGLAVTTLPLLRSNDLGRVVAALFLASPIMASIGSLAGFANASFALASGLFGIGLIVTGILLLRCSNSATAS